MADEEKDVFKDVFKDDKKLLVEARKFLIMDIDDAFTERANMLDDLNFCTLDQWPKEIRHERENDQENGPRPCLTIDKINQYIVQIVNDMRQGKPGIIVRAQDDNADVETAKVLRGIIRNIEDQSKADIAYSTAGESSAKIGLGYFRITTEYVSEDSFDQEIFIRPIPNTFSVYLGPHIFPDGSDSKRGFIIETMPLDKFRTEYPKAKYKSGDFEGLGDRLSYWHTGETVTVIEYYCIERKLKRLLFLADGTTMTQEDYDKWPPEAGVKPTIQKERSTFSEQLKWAKMTGVEVLDKRDLPGKFIPIVEVIGRESNIQGRRILWGLVRPAKDSLRMYNYFASTITEKMGLAPKAPFVGAKGQFENLEDKWKKANRVNYAFLEYNPIDVNGNAIPPPQRQAPSPMEAALLHQMQVIEHDVQTSLGMFKAAVGETESQQSGRAILALQKESDTGTYHFGANLGVSIRQCGKIILDMIPHYYDTKRIVRILGEDGEVQNVQIDPNQQEAHRQVQGPQGIQSIHNPGVGKYDVSITVGPSYATKRMEAMTTFVEMAKGAADPASAAILRYLVMRNSDSAGSDEAAKLLKTMLPPPALQALASKQPIPPEAQAQMQQMMQKMQMMQEEGQKLHEELQKAQAGVQVGMAKVQVESQTKQQQAQLDQQEAQTAFQLQKQKQDAELQLEREKAEAEIKLKYEVAQADIEIEKLKAGLSAEAEVDQAIAKVSALATVHQTKVQGIFDKETAAREAEGEAKDEADSQAQVKASQDQFMQAIQEIVKSLTAKKNISMKLSDGRTATAQVSVGSGTMQ